MSLAVNGTLNGTLNSTLNPTAIPLSAGVAGLLGEVCGNGFRKEDHAEEPTNGVDLKSIDFDDRKQKIADKFRAMLNADGDVVW